MIISQYFVDRSIKDIGLSIPAGVYMKLNIKIWDYQVKAEMKISTSTPQFYMNIELPPMEMLWGMIVIYKQKDDKKNGPKFLVDIKQGMVKADIQGKTVYQILTWSTGSASRIFLVLPKSFNTI